MIYGTIKYNKLVEIAKKCNEAEWIARLYCIQQRKSRLNSFSCNNIQNICFNQK